MGLLEIINYEISKSGGKEKLIQLMEIELSNYDKPSIPRFRYVKNKFYRSYTPEEDAIISQFYGKLLYKQIAAKINRSYDSINKRVAVLKLHKYEVGIRNKS